MSTSLPQLNKKRRTIAGLWLLVLMFGLLLPLFAGAGHAPAHGSKSEAVHDRPYCHSVSFAPSSTAQLIVADPHSDAATDLCQELRCSQCMHCTPLASAALLAALQQVELFPVPVSDLVTPLALRLERPPKHPQA